MRAHRCAAALLLLTLRDAKARTLPHVVDGMYDTTWYAVDVTSLDGLRRVAPAHGWTVLAGRAPARETGSSKTKKKTGGEELATS